MIVRLLVQYLEYYATSGVVVVVVAGSKTGGVQCCHGDPPGEGDQGDCQLPVTPSKPV